MKKIFLMILISVVTATTTIGCSKVIGNDNWRIVRAPSGTCYEAYDTGLGNHRVFALGKQVACPLDQLK